MAATGSPLESIGATRITYLPSVSALNLTSRPSAERHVRRSPPDGSFTATAMSCPAVGTSTDIATMSPSLRSTGMLFTLKSRKERSKNNDAAGGTGGRVITGKGVLLGVTVGPGEAVGEGAGVGVAVTAGVGVGVGWLLLQPTVPRLNAAKTRAKTTYLVVRRPLVVFHPAL